MAAMAPYSTSDADYLRDKARRDLLTLLEAVSKAPPDFVFKSLSSRALG